MPPKSKLGKSQLQQSQSANEFRAMKRDASTRRIFQLKHGSGADISEWIVIEEENAEEGDFEHSHNALLSATAYLDMLNDSERNAAFRDAIDKTITKPSHVLDVGAGTGLLSMMASRAMSRENSPSPSPSFPVTGGMVTACESFLPMVNLMHKVLHVNGMRSKIKVISKRSDELELGVDISSRADVLVSEILDSELLGEGLIPSLQHAHDKLLVENPLTVPYCATTYGQLVESTLLWKMHDLCNHEAGAPDGVRLAPAGLDAILRVKAQQHPFHCDAISSDLKLLSEPFMVFKFDFWRSPETSRHTEILINAISDGTVHAVISWWVLQLDQEGTILYSTAPRWVDSTSSTRGGGWRDHWKQCVWFVPREGILVSEGKELVLHAVHTSTSISYDLRLGATERRQYDCGSSDFHLMMSPERISIYGDASWRCSILNVLRSALQRRVQEQPLCIVADDSVFLPLVVARISRSTSLISLFPGLRDAGRQYVQSVAGMNGFDAGRVKVAHKKSLLLSDVNRKADLFIGEPFYYGCDAKLPWQSLQFWKDRTMLGSIIGRDTFVMPCKALLKACAMSFPDLWRSRSCLGKIEGFDHSVANATLGAFQEGPLLPFFMWQCGETKELSEVVTILEFDFTKPIRSCFGEVQVKFTKAGTCHGFAIWIDWVMDEATPLVISTGPDQRYWKQGVRLSSHPFKVNPNLSSSVGLEASFDPSSSSSEIVVRNI